MKEDKGEQLPGCKKNAFLLHLEEKALEQRAWPGAGEVTPPVPCPRATQDRAPSKGPLLLRCCSEEAGQGKLCRGCQASAPSLAELIQSLCSAQGVAGAPPWMPLFLDAHWSPWHLRVRLCYRVFNLAPRNQEVHSHKSFLRAFPPPLGVFSLTAQWRLQEPLLLQI